MKKSKRYTESEMFAHYEAWKKSGVTQKNYCIEQRIFYSTLKFWATRYNKRNPAKSTRPGFIPVKLRSINDQGKSASTGQLHFLFPSGVQMVCPETIDHRVLKNLINP